MARTVEHQFDQEALEKLFANTDPKEVLSAIGYLATWAMDSERYADCTIWIASTHDEICANYRQHDGVKTQYCIGAVWNGERFGFHS